MGAAAFALRSAGISWSHPLEKHGGMNEHLQFLVNPLVILFGAHILKQQCVFSSQVDKNYIADQPLYFGVTKSMTLFHC